METIVLKNHEFSKVDATPFNSLYFNAGLELAICVADEEYIPIDHFKKIFERVTQLSDQYRISSFLFDKRELRTFHQPSMEWYFSVWKPVMRDRGLKKHYKILPEQEWFVKAVEAGKHEIYQKFGKDIVAGISIDYLNSAEEVIDRIEGQQLT